MPDYWKEAGIQKPTEIIVCAANRYGDLIVAGARHHDRVMNGVLRKIEGIPRKGDQGFINQFGEFRTREEAYKIVQENGQPFNQERNGTGDKLYSEGLY